jgi:hypothetical protein
VGLIDEALIFYDELEGMFKEYVYNSPSFLVETANGHMGFLKDVFSFDGADYRDKIFRNQISALELSCYLFARKASLMIKSGNVIKLIVYGHQFANSLIIVSMHCALISNVFSLLPKIKWISLLLMQSK